MARTKEFDSHEALEAAMMLFWAQGYTATSINQLVDVMGISRSSMYAEFGNKRDLFIETLSLYRFLSTELFDTIARADNPVDVIKDFFQTGFIKLPDQWLNQGCLLVNTILELRDVDNELSSIAARYTDEVENEFAACFQKCIANGTLERGHNPERLANFFMTTMKGMRVVARQNVDRDYLHGVIETAMLVLSNNATTTQKAN